MIDMEGRDINISVLVLISLLLRKAFFGLLFIYFSAFFDSNQTTQPLTPT